ncbi:MAG: SDR family NAD(P)-dependent oxidoreductase [Thiotrichales bacterium]
MSRPDSETARHAWIVGASTGFGLALGAALRKRDWTVTLSARNLARLEQAAASIGAAHVGVDVSDRAGFQAAIQTIFRTTPPDTVVLNAAEYEPMPLADFDSALFERLIRTNYLGVVYGLEALLPAMRANGGGQILITASIAGYRGLPLAAPYSATKAALINLAEALAPEAARWGIRLRLINPGFIRTPMTGKNPFKMPFLLEPEAAAAYVVRAIDRDGFEIAFPRRFAYLMKLLRILPYRLYFPLMRLLSQ